MALTRSVHHQTDVYKYFIPGHSGKCSYLTEQVVPAVMRSLTSRIRELLSERRRAAVQTMNKAS